MSYYFSRTINASQSDAIDRIRTALATKGFGVLTTIDVAATMKSKLGEDFRPYMILGACNPHFAWRAQRSPTRRGGDRSGRSGGQHGLDRQSAPGGTGAGGARVAAGGGRGRLTWQDGESHDGPAKRPFLSVEGYLYSPCRPRLTMEINGRCNKPFGPGGGTRRLHQEPRPAPRLLMGAK